MDTRDLESYILGYDEYNETMTIATEEYQKLKEQIKTYEKTVEDLKELLNDNQQYETLEMIKMSFKMLKGLEEELGEL